MPPRKRDAAVLKAIVRHALKTLDADRSPAHVEDVTVACFQLAPQLFGMQRHPEYPRLDTAYYALKNLKPEGHVSGGLRDGWMLTRVGVEWLEDNAQHVESLLTGVVTVERPDQGGVVAARSDLAQIRQHPAHRAFEAGSRSSTSRQVLAEVLGCSAGSMPSTWRAQFSRVYSLASDLDPDLLRFLAWIEAENPELLRGES